MLLSAIHFYGLLLACTFTRSYSAFKNDATEILYSHVVKPAPASPSSNSTLNQARNGGRHYAGTGSDRNSEYPTGGPSPRPLLPGPGAPRAQRPGDGAEGRCRGRWLCSVSPPSTPAPASPVGPALSGRSLPEGSSARFGGLSGREER